MEALPPAPPHPPHGVYVTLEELGILKSWFMVLNSVSLVLSTTTMLTNLSSAKKRAFPSRLTTCFAASAVGFHASLLLAYWQDFPALMIHPEDVPEADSQCGVQGALFAYFASSLSWWWFLISFNLYRVVHDEFTIRDARKLEPYYHVCCWLVPLAQTVVLVLAKKIGTETGALYCWITVRDGAMWKLFFFYAILALFCVLGVYWGVRIIYKLAIFHRRRLRVLHAETMRARLQHERAAKRSSRAGSAATGGLGSASVVVGVPAGGSPDMGRGRGTPSAAARRSSAASQMTSGGAGNLAGANTAAAAGGGHGGYFSYYIFRQTLFMMVMLLRFIVFVVWQGNYMLFQHDRAGIRFWLCFLVNYFVSTVGSDCFFLICLTRENTNALLRLFRRARYCMGHGCEWPRDEDGNSVTDRLLPNSAGEADDEPGQSGRRGRGGNGNGNDGPSLLRALSGRTDTSMSSNEGETMTAGLAAMTPEPPKRHPRLPAPDRA